MIEIEIWPIARPIPYPKNSRKHSAASVAKIASSIREFGWRQPIVVDVKDVIVMGHGRLAAAHDLKLIEVPVHVARDLSPAQIKALRIMDNRAAEESEWDNALLGPELLELKLEQFDVDLTGFEQQEIIETVFGAGKGKKKNGGSSESKDGFEFKVIVECASEEHQTELLERFRAEGLGCKALIA